MRLSEVSGHSRAKKNIGYSNVIQIQGGIFFSPFIDSSDYLGIDIFTLHWVTFEKEFASIDQNIFDR